MTGRLPKGGSFFVPMFSRNSHNKLALTFISINYGRHGYAEVVDSSTSVDPSVSEPKFDQLIGLSECQFLLQLGKGRRSSSCTIESIIKPNTVIQWLLKVRGDS